MLRELRVNRVHGLLAVVGALLIGCVLLAGGPEEVLAALPLVAILVALGCNRYPGERLIERIAGRRRGRVRRTPSVTPRRERLEVPVPSLGRLSGTRDLRGPPLLSSYAI